MSRDFKGKNDIDSSFNLYYWRTKFLNNAYGDSIGPIMVRDYRFAERQHYGLLDSNGDVVVPIEDKMLPIKNADRPELINYTFDFVAHMFVDLKAHIELAVASGLICEDSSIIGRCIPVKSYVSPNVMYQNYIDEIIATFIKVTIPETYGSNNIMDFKSFVKYFLSHANDYLVKEPITYSGWLMSKKSTYFNSALGISISQLDAGDDQPKIDKMIDDPAFTFFKRLVLNYGFSLDFNIPWNLLVDLGSPAVNKYFGIYGIDSIQNLFDTYYIKAYYSDIDILKNRLIHFYNIFVILNEKEIQFSSCSKKTKWVSVYRSQTTQAEVDLNFDNAYWLEYLIDLKCYELNKPFNNGTIRQIKTHAKKIEKIFDNTQALDYINNETKGFIFKRDYGLQWLYEQQQKLAKKELEDKGITGETVTGGSSGGGY